MIIKGGKDINEINTNLNNILNEYGITFKGDSLDNQKLSVNFEGDNIIEKEFKNKNKSLNINYPNGQSLNIDESNPSIISLYTNYPNKKYIFAMANSKSGKGKICAFGSSLFFENSVIYSQENPKFITALIKYLLGINDDNNMIDNKNPLLNLNNSFKADWKDTFKMYSSLIQKPKMTEKLLKRPPPKYIFDIIKSTMDKTGFPKGLYTELELDNKYFMADGRNKIKILNKAIDITKLVLKEKFEINCLNILRGVETEQTNYFLQMFYKAATTNKISLEEKNKIIQKYLIMRMEKNLNPPKNKEEENEQINFAIEQSKKEMELIFENEKEEQKQIELALKESEKEYKMNQINNNDDDEEYDEFFGICPITQEYMKNPVLCPSGHYYEKSAIIEWIQKNNTDPMTREKLTVDMLIEDEEYKKKIIEYRKKFDK